MERCPLSEPSPPPTSCHTGDRLNYISEAETTSILLLVSDSVEEARLKPQGATGRLDSAQTVEKSNARKTRLP